MFSIAEEYKKNPELKQEDVDHIKEWISKQPHLPNIKGKIFILFEIEISVSIHFFFVIRGCLFRCNVRYCCLIIMITFYYRRADYIISAQLLL